MSVFSSVSQDNGIKQVCGRCTAVCGRCTAVCRSCPFSHRTSARRLAHATLGRGTKMLRQDSLGGSSPVSTSSSLSPKLADSQTVNRCFSRKWTATQHQFSSGSATVMVRFGLPRVGGSDEFVWIWCDTEPFIIEGLSGQPVDGLSQVFFNINAGKCEVQAMTCVMASRSYSSFERHVSKKRLICSTRSEDSPMACRPSDTP